MTRAERVGELIKQEVSDILRKDISDPRIGFVSITRVDVTEDMKLAKISVSVFEEGEKKEASMTGLNSAKGFIRSILAPRLDLRSVPEIDFLLDNSIEKASKVFALMHRLEGEKPKKAGKKKNG